MRFLNKLIKYCKESREREEELQRNLEILLYYDKSLTEEQYDRLRDIIHYGGYEIIYNPKWEKSYREEARIYQEVTKKNKDAKEVYEILKRDYL